MKKLVTLSFATDCLGMGNKVFVATLFDFPLEKKDLGTRVFVFMEGLSGVRTKFNINWETRIG